MDQGEKNTGLCHPSLRAVARGSRLLLAGPGAGPSFFLISTRFGNFPPREHVEFVLFAQNSRGFLFAPLPGSGRPGKRDHPSFLLAAPFFFAFSAGPGTATTAAGRTRQPPTRFVRVSSRKKRVWKIPQTPPLPNLPFSVLKRLSFARLGALLP